MGWFSDAFGGGGKRARKERDYWRAQAQQHKTWSHGLAAENKARIKMAATLKAQRNAETKRFKQQSAAALRAERRRGNQRLTTQANRLHGQYKAQAAKVTKQRKADSFAMRGVEKQRLKMEKFKTVKETVITPSVSGERKQQAGSMYGMKAKPKRRIVGSSGRRGGGGRSRGGSRTRPA